MTTSTRYPARRRAGWRAGFIAAALSAILAGCATQPGVPSASDMVGAEETDNRRRARIRMELAVGYFEEGKTEIALEELRQVITIDPTLPDAYNLRGLIFMRLNDARQAEESFRRALAFNPRDADVLHNYGWLQCQGGRYDDAIRTFEQALASPTYGGRAKTLMAQGICQARAGRMDDAERTLARAYELDAGNPVTGYNLANLLYRKGDYQRAQFYIRRLNNTELANAETLWLGIRVERRMNDRVAMQQLGEQLRKRFPQSAERAAYDKGSFDE